MSNKKLDPRVIRTREMLREALMILIEKRGYNALTVQDITKQAGLNRATFYLHYRDKQDLLMHIIDEVLNALTRMPHQIKGTIQPSDLTDLFIQMFDHVAYHHVFYRIMLEETSVAPYVQHIQEHIQLIAESWLKQNPRPLLTPPDLFVNFIGHAFLGVVKWWVRHDLPYTSEYMALQFIRLAIGGMQYDFGLVDVMQDLEARLRMLESTS